MYLSVRTASGPSYVRKCAAPGCLTHTEDRFLRAGACPDCYERRYGGRWQRLPAEYRAYVPGIGRVA